MGDTFELKLRSSNKAENYLNRLLHPRPHFLDKYGQRGVKALSEATPVESGETATAWDYEIIQKKHGYKIIWTNSHMAGTTSVAVLLQYGHGTGTGGRVQGRDYINPAMKHVFEEIANDAWREVTSK